MHAFIITAVAFILSLFNVFASSAAAQTATAAPEFTLTQIQQRNDFLHASLDERVRIAERLGEQGAEKWAKKQGYKPILRQADKSVSQGFDQVYIDRSGRTVVIEAKGGTSPIRQAYGHAQGTQGWAVEAAKKTLQSPAASAAEKQAAESVLDAARKGKLVVQTVRTKHVHGVPYAATLEKTSEGGTAAKKAAADYLAARSKQTSALNSAPKRTSPAPSVGTKPNRVRIRTRNAVRPAGRVGIKSTVKSAVKSVTKCLPAAKPLVRGAAVGTVVGTVGGPVGVAVSVAVDGYGVVNEAAETEVKYHSGQISSRDRYKSHARGVSQTAGGAAGAWGGRSSRRYGRRRRRDRRRTGRRCRRNRCRRHRGRHRRILRRFIRRLGYRGLDLRLTPARLGGRPTRSTSR